MLLEEADDRAAASAAATTLAHKSPLRCAILDACETLKALQESSSSSAAATATGNGNGNSNNGGNQRPAFSGEALAGAKGLIFMRTDKIGFGVSVTQGYGLLLARRGPSSWSPPLPLKIDGCSLGAVAGYAEQRTLLALASDAEVREFCCCASSGEEGSGKKSSSKKGGGQGRRLKIGLDLTLGLGKRLNQSASVDAKAKAAATGGEQPASAAAPAAPTPATTRAFTLSKGYIVDVSLRGLFVEPDADDLARAYGEGITAEDVLFGGAGGEGGRGDGGELVTAPAEAALLYRALKAAEEGGVAGGVKA